MERTDRLERADREELRRIAANVRRHRKALKWSQEELAERASIDEKQVQRIEAGEINIGVRSLLRVVRALGISLGDLAREPSGDELAASPTRPLAAAEHVLKRARPTRKR